MQDEDVKMIHQVVEDESKTLYDIILQSYDVKSLCQLYGNSHDIKYFIHYDVQVTI